MPLWHAAAIAADEQPAAGAPAPAATPEAKPGGVQVQVPESPAMTPVSIGYLREIPDSPRPASRMDNEPDDAGIAGAKLAIQENNAGGQFTGDLYSLDVIERLVAQKIRRDRMADFTYVHDTSHITASAHGGRGGGGGRNSRRADAVMAFLDTHYGRTASPAHR
jgi:hypothetical protein